MAGLEDLHRHAAGQLGVQPEPRAKHLEDERIADADQFHPAAHADPECLEPLRVFVLRLHAAHHRADAQGQQIQPDQRNRFGNGRHNKAK